MDLVSIILPTVNRCSMLEERLAEVAGQTYPNIEVIVVDDGSSDSTKYVCGRWNEKLNIKYTRIDPNSGCECVPRSIGISYSSGTLIAHFDDDVVQYPNKIEDLVSGIGKSDLAIGLSEIERKGTVNQLSMLDDSQVLYKRSVFEHMPFLYGNIQEGFIQIVEMYRRIRGFGSISYVHSVVARVLLHGGNWSWNPKSRILTPNDFLEYNKFFKYTPRIEITHGPYKHESKF